MFLTFKFLLANELKNTDMVSRSKASEHSEFFPLLSELRGFTYPHQTESLWFRAVSKWGLRDKIHHVQLYIYKIRKSIVRMTLSGSGIRDTGNQRGQNEKKKASPNQRNMLKTPRRKYVRSERRSSVGKKGDRRWLRKLPVLSGQ